MKAVIAQKPGPAEVLKICEIDDPIVSDAEILVEIRTIGINRADLILRSGIIPGYIEANPVLGAEFSGTVKSVGPSTSKFKVGDDVVGIVPKGSYAQLISVPEPLLFQLPPFLSHKEKAAIPEVFITAFQLLNRVAKCKEGKSILIHAAASGIGTATIQLAKIMGLKVYATSRETRKLEFCKKLGADHIIQVSHNQFSEKILALSENQGVDTILDCVGKNYIEENLNSLAQEGCLVLYGDLSGTVKEFDFGVIIDKWATVIGTTFQGRSLPYKESLIKDMLEFIEPHLKSKKIKPIIDQVFSVNEVVKAHQYMEKNKNIGKVVLSWQD